MTIPVPDGYFIERTELEHSTDYHVFRENGATDENDQPVPIMHVVVWRGQANARPPIPPRVLWLSTGSSYRAPDAARAYAAALSLAADDADGLLRIVEVDG